MSGVRFLDPLYGRVLVGKEFVPIVFSPELQRLRYVRLCNINSLFLQGASEPKRFEHSIGVFELASRWASVHKIDRHSSFVVRAAALVHDIQTGPFGHSLQYIFEDNDFESTFSHEELEEGASQRFHQRSAAASSFAGAQFSLTNILGNARKEVFEASAGKGRFGPLVAGTIDLDNLDNVVRLAFHMGLCTDDERKIPEKLVGCLHLSASGGLALSDLGFRRVEQWLQVRQRLYRYLLLNRGEFAAKAMLTRAAEIGVAFGLLGPDCWTYTDDELLHYLVENGIGEQQEMKRIVRRLQLGDLFHCLGIWTSPSVPTYDRVAGTSAKREMEIELRRRIASTTGRKVALCLHHIKDVGKTERALSLARVTSGDRVTFGADSHCVHTGLFVTNETSEPLDEAFVQACEPVVLDFLSERGLDNAVPAADPLGDEQDSRTQPDLFALA